MVQPSSVSVAAGDPKVLVAPPTVVAGSEADRTADLGLGNSCRAWA